jgi:hypothetical protein
MLYGCRMNNDRTSYELAGPDFALNRFAATREGWMLFETEAEAIAFGEAQVATQAAGAFAKGTDAQGH